MSLRFSQRKGLTPIRTEMQIDSMDDDLRNRLWNSFKLFYLSVVEDYMGSNSYISLRFTPGAHNFFAILWHRFFKLPIDSIDLRYTTTYDQLRKWFFSWPWFQVYDFIEFISNIETSDLVFDKEGFINTCNSILERELAGYRFVNGLITPITNETELQEIESAIQESRKTKLSGVETHLHSALEKLSDRKAPDYRNSIKESISAVEALYQKITGNPNASLGDALDVIEREGKIDLHPTLKQAYSKIYGYSSNADGIRHAMSEQSTCDFADAKYMLVSCSAFINYLIEKAAKAGIKF